MTSRVRSMANDEVNENSSSKGDNLNFFRNLLEASWDTKAMGIIPSDPENAAKAAGKKPTWEHSRCDDCC